MTDLIYIKTFFKHLWLEAKQFDLVVWVITTAGVFFVPIIHMQGREVGLLGQFYAIMGLLVIGYVFIKAVRSANADFGEKND